MIRDSRHNNADITTPSSEDNLSENCHGDNKPTNFIFGNDNNTNIPNTPYPRSSMALGLATQPMKAVRKERYGFTHRNSFMGFT